jgi:hypothetical protein
MHGAYSKLCPVLLPSYIEFSVYVMILFSQTAIKPCLKLASWFLASLSTFNPISGVYATNLSI